jgi:hypothetical protein
MRRCPVNNKIIAFVLALVLAAARFFQAKFDAAASYFEFAKGRDPKGKTPSELSKSFSDQLNRLKNEDPPAPPPVS